MKEGRREWQGKSLNDVDIRDDFMFSYIMRDPELCLGLLRQLLPDCPIERIEYVELEAEKQQLEKALGTRLETQKALFGAAGKRSVRLDAYLDDGKTIYNIEMQTAEQIALPQRSRLYQAHIDVNQLERGQYYDELRPSYVIFICTFDPFGKSLYRYSFRNVCREDGEVELQDEAYKLFFNTKGTRGEIPEALKEMLAYINNPEEYPVEESKLKLIHRLDEAVETAKMSEDWRRAYMTYQTHLRDAQLEGIAIGRKEGWQEGRKEGRQEGRQEGRKEGRLEGRKEGLLEAAKAMLQGHLPVEQIVRFTGLSQEDVQKLTEENPAQ